MTKASKKKVATKDKDGNIIKYELPKDRFLGVKRYTDMDTGEIIEVPLVEKSIAENKNFDMILYGIFLNLLDEIGNKKIKVLKYLVSNRIKINNLVPYSVQELADGCGVSYKTAWSTVQTLESAGVIRRKTGKIYIDHSLIMDGRYKKGIMTVFNEVEAKPVIELKPPTNQTSILDEDQQNARE